MATVKALVVGGGGWGGGNSGGWGGWWQFTYNSALTVTPQAYSVTVWTWWTAGWTTTDWWNGNSSIFSSITSTGGIWWEWDTVRSWVWWASGNSFSWGNYITVGNDLWGGGGWGSSAVGANAVAWQAGSWGAGTANSISWSSVTYAGWGWGGWYNTSPYFDLWWAGTDGGWNWWSTTAGTAGTANRGGGGGWGSAGNRVWWAGWSWVVIISYATDWSDWVSISSTGGTITTSGWQTIHTFTTSGTFTMVWTALPFIPKITFL